MILWQNAFIHLRSHKPVLQRFRCDLKLIKHTYKSFRFNLLVFKGEYSLKLYAAI